ncbi:MAG TPA: DUF1963 domain-containing protein [Bryobacteraceae bacterium]|nr:DUF1963 domain-containing protein [Bryobacteraceae bacterium]
MSIPRSLAVFLCAAGAALVLAIGKASVVSGVNTLPPVKALVFAASTFGLIAALLDWALLRGWPKVGPMADAASAKPVSREGRSQHSAAVLSPISKARAQAPENAAGWSKPEVVAANGPGIPPQTQVPQAGPIVERGSLSPIVFREICPPPSMAGLSFYGGVPVGPAQLVWPLVRNKEGNSPLSFILQVDCAELAAQDGTGLIPDSGVLYLFADLTWGDPFDFQFIHTPGPENGSQSLPIPAGLPPVYGDQGAYQVPYCSPWIPEQGQDVPRFLPKWPFLPIALSYPPPPNNAKGEDRGALFWNDGDAAGEALLLVEHPRGIPLAKRREELQRLPFGRPFAAFPHDHAAVRVVVAKVLDELRRPESWLLREASEAEREAKFQVWRDEAVKLYATAATHRPAARVEPAMSDDIWHWMEGLEAVLARGWGPLVAECVNVTLGLGSEAAAALPADLVATCAERHALASAYLHEEYPDWSRPDAVATWKARKAEGSLKEMRSLHAPCPNHMFGPPSFVQGYVEEYLEEWLLLLELSSREPIGLKFGEGVLQFMIRPADLRERRFDNVKLIASAY